MKLYRFNKVGALVDYPDTAREQPISNFEQEQLNLSPTVAVYKAESIINWHTIEVNNEIIPDYFVLDETHMAMNPETYCYEEKEQYRILFLKPNGNDYVYCQFVVIRIDDERRSIVGNKKLFKVIDYVEPMMNGSKLNRIPFFVIDKDGLNYDKTTESIINGLTDVNLGHYRNSADWEHNLFYLGLKTLIVKGYNAETGTGKLTVGGVISSTNPQFDALLLEPSSDSGLEKEMQNKEQRMAVLGSQAIAQRGKYVQSAATAKINSSSEASVLSAVAHAQSNVMTTILNLILQWGGYTDVQGSLHINTDFFDDLITPESILKFVQLVQSGGISYDTFYYNLSKRDVYPPEWTKEKEKSAIEDGGLTNK
jgi:hypothetical protein